MKDALEVTLYPSVAEWLHRTLKDSHRRAKVAAYDTHNLNLSDILRRERLDRRFGDCDSQEIQVDVTGIVETAKSVRLAFVECKIGMITLRDVGQLLGYSLVARPEWSYLVSPAGVSPRLRNLLVTFGRQDILNYAKNRHIRVAKWNIDRNEIDVPSVIPAGTYGYDME